MWTTWEPKGHQNQAGLAEKLIQQSAGRPTNYHISLNSVLHCYKYNTLLYFLYVCDIYIRLRYWHVYFPNVIFRYKERSSEVWQCCHLSGCCFEHTRCKKGYYLFFFVSPVTGKKTKNGVSIWKRKKIRHQLSQCFNPINPEWLIPLPAVWTFSTSWWSSYSRFKPVKRLGIKASPTITRPN